MSYDAEPGGSTAPGHPSVVIARVIRKLTGVREELLANVPAERTKYTALAAVMICTASFGGIAMFFTLTETLGQAEAWFVPAAICWAAFILCVDCWLVSSTAGAHLRTRISVLLPRLAIAAVFGVVIAEPLVLRLFQTGIDEHVIGVRQTAIDNLRTALVNCNPIPGIATGSAPGRSGCAGMTLNIASPAAATLARLSLLQGQDSMLLTAVNTETQQVTRLQNIVNDECNGVSGIGLTGILGDGPACQKDQQDVSAYLASHPIGTQSAELTTLNQQVRTLQTTLAGQQARYRTAITQVIAEQLRQQIQPNAPIGMAERFQALSYLARSNSFIAVASWFVRIFFILIDCLPVLVKFIGGRTTYDKLADTEIASSERRFKAKSNLADAIEDEKNSEKLYRAKADAAQRKREIDLEMLRHDAERGRLKDQAVAELARRKYQARSGATTSPMPAMAERGWRAGASWSEGDLRDQHPNGSSGRVRSGDPKATDDA
jgi:hypothetical protein